MDEIFQNFVKFLSKTIIVHIYSSPHFSFEVILACIVCIVHVLLIFEVNSIYRRTNAKAAAKIRTRHPQLKDIESCSYHTISRLETRVFPQKIETTTTRQSYYVRFPKHLKKKTSAASNCSWLISDGNIGHDFYERVDHILSISPSEYVKKDKERKSQDGLRTCIQSLTMLLEKTLNDDNAGLENLTKDAIKRSINTLKENMDNQANRGNHQLCEFETPSIQSLMAHSLSSNALRHTLTPPLVTSFPVNKSEDKLCENEYYKYTNEKNSITNLFEKKSSGNLSDLFKEIDQDQRILVSV